MKKGFFSTLIPLTYSAAVMLMLSGCSSFLLLGENAEDPGEYDRGYAKNEAGGEELANNTETQKARSEEGNPFNEPSYEKSRIRRAIEMRDVVLGMTRQDVLQSWGHPAQREVAGRGGGGHERWVYGSRYSLNGSRTVIFENGKVAGWSH